MSITVMIVDDQPLVRAGIAMLLSGEADLVVVGEARSGHEALAMAHTTCTEVVLMDVRMPGMDGITATRELVRESRSNPDRLTRVLIMTTFDEESVVIEALQAGASGYLLKHASPTEIADAVRRVAAGDTWLDATAVTRLVQRLRSKSSAFEDPSGLLTPREKQLLRYMAMGLSNRDIRDLLVLSEATVKTHVSRILLKTGSRDRAAAVALAYRSGFVHPDDPVPQP